MAPKLNQGSHQVLIDEPLPPGFSEQWTQMHPALAAVLADEGIAVGDYSDAKFLSNDRFATKENVARWLELSYKYIHLHKDREQQKQLIHQQLHKLIILAKRTPTIEQLSETGRSRMMERPGAPLK